MKPKLGRVVYTVYQNDITKNKVAFLGKESFITDSYGGLFIDDSWEHYYDNYGHTWFTTLKDAKKYVMESLTEDEQKTVKWKAWSAGNYWELIDKE